MRWLKRLLAKLFRSKVDYDDDDLVATVPLSRNPSVKTADKSPEGWPPGAYAFVSGSWYVPFKGQHGGPFSSPAEAWDWMRRVEASAAASEEADRTQSWGVPGRGRIPATSLSPADAAYLWSRQAEYRLRVHNGDLFRDVCSGTHDEIATAIALGDRTNPGMAAATPSNPAVAAAAEEAFGRV